ncbi:hypothetical protein [Ferdinandcohnia sp. Marseille-Q9671]
MTAFTCSILSQETTIVFAKEELLKYGGQVHQPISYSFIIGLEKDFLEKGLLDQPLLTDSLVDAFQVVYKGNDIYIIGSNPRSVLFGVYHLCKKLFGFKWVNFLSKEKLEYKEDRFVPSTVQNGNMKRRGLVIENYDDTSFLLQLIDWAGKHYINELFFTFMLWDKVKQVVEPEIEKRGLSITIGGHSMHYLLKGISDSDKQQINYKDDGWKAPLIDKIRGYLEQSSSINRLSLWPADIGIDDDQDFLTCYIEFTEQVKKELPSIEVEHIAYNAGLSWDMLELADGGASSKTVNTLFAYWGRNYQQSFTKEERAYDALQKWCHATKANQQQLTVFEYYSDHFMLGDLFPPLFHRIHEDIKMYSNLGIEQMVNLIVPYIPKEDASDLDHQFPWELLQLLNSYYFARLTWGDDFEEIEEDFYSIFDDQQMEVKQVFRKMESILSEVSGWNVPLFPSRVIDPEKVTEYMDVQYIISDLKKWKKEAAPLQLHAVNELVDPFTMISFYRYYICEKLEEYLCKWENKAAALGKRIT